MSSESLSRTLARTEGVLLGLPTVEGALARHEAAAPAPGDTDLLRDRVAAVVAAQAADGSWNGSVGETGSALLELAELAAVLGEGVVPGPGVGDGAAHHQDPISGRPAVVPPQTISAGLSWLRVLRGGVGRFGSGCEPVWHRAGLCEHTLKGFHGLPRTGEPARDADTLVIDSARATEAALCWGETGPPQRHLESLCLVVSHWAWPEGDPLLKAASAVAALAALLRGPVSPGRVRTIAEGIACLLRTQRADGTWHGAPLYDVLELLLAGVARGYHVPEVDAALTRAAQLLVLTQKPDGTWGAKAGPRQPLIAWRVLRHGTGISAGQQPAPA